MKLDWGPGSLEKSLPDVTTHHVVAVQSLSRVRLFVTPWTAPHQASLSFTSPGACSNSCLSNQWCHPTISSSVVPFSSCLQTRRIRIFSNESVFHIRWAKYWSFSFSISLSNEYSGLISFTIDWFDLFSVQGIWRDSQESSPTLQFESIDSLAVSLFMVQLSHPHETTGNTLALNTWMDLWAG